MNEPVELALDELALLQEINRDLRQCSPEFIEGVNQVAYWTGYAIHYRLDGNIEQSRWAMENAKRLYSELVKSYAH